METRELYQRFERLIIRIFEFNRFDVRTTRIGRDPGYDLDIASPDGRRAVVEIKFFRSLQAPRSVVINGANRLLLAAQNSSAAIVEQRITGIFVTNARLDQSIKQELRRDDDLVIWDFDTIATLASADPELSKDFDVLMQEGFAYRNEPIPTSTPNTHIPFVGDIRPATAEVPENAVAGLAASKSGEDLCRALRESISGALPHSTIFETICGECLRYLFADDLIGWTTQRDSATKLHRYDLIARVSSKSDFWNSLISDYRARYIIFEFKNYADPITQKEVYSTEKYLLPLAMRSMAIIISREGADINAHKVMAGALREAGKLILTLSINDMCDMLHKKDHGDDPSDYLADRLENMMSEIER